MDNNVRTETLSALDLAEWASQLIDAVKRSLEPDAPTNPGAHCKFCRAASFCPGLRNHALAVARMEFSAPKSPPAPDALTPEEVGLVLSQAEVVEKWLDAVRARALLDLESGVDVPGWKLVQKRAIRRWANEDVPAGCLRSAGLTDDDIYVKKLISPAQAEKLLGKSGRDAIEALVVAESSGTTLAPAGDKRPAVNRGAASDFTAITN